METEVLEYSKLFKTTIGEIKSEIEKLSLVHGEKRIAKYNAIQKRIATCNTYIRTINMELRSLKPDKKTKWQTTVTQYKTTLEQVTAESDIARKLNWNKEDEDEDFFDLNGNVNAKKSTTEIIKKAINIQNQDIDLLKDMIKDIKDITK